MQNAQRAVSNAGLAVHNAQRTINNAQLAMRIPKKNGFGFDSKSVSFSNRYRMR